MLTVMIHGREQVDNCGFQGYSLLVTLALTTRNDLWTPINIYAVLTESEKFHIEQIKKWAVKNKMRVLCCRLDVRKSQHKLNGMCVPHDDVWPFDGFARIDYEPIRTAAFHISLKDQHTDASIITLWRKP